jgi:ABC-type multidrug transport system ATPase subunit
VSKLCFNILIIRIEIFSYALMGSSGCGKTTLISSLVGISKVDSGDIKLFGQPVNRSQALRIGYMPQETALIDNFSIREIVWFFGAIYGMKPKNIEKRFEFLSTLFELPDEEKLINECSGGQQRRISLVLSMIHEPELLILDEPTVGVDSVMRNAIWEFLTALASSKKATILLSTHYLDEAKRSNRVGFIRKGVLAAENSPKNILKFCGTSNMDEAFIKLCKNQNSHFSDFHPFVTQKVEEKRQKAGTQSSTKIVHALMTKCWLDVTKNFM